MDIVFKKIYNMGLEEEAQADLINREAELYEQRLKKAGEKTKSISQELGATFKSAAEEAVVSWDGFGNLLQGIEQDIIRLATRKVLLDPLLGAIDSLLSSGGSGSGSGGGGIIESIASFFSFNAKGNVYQNSPSLSAYSGGVYTTPKAFAFAKGAGVFAEAGAEAIMPLTRGQNGKLGVHAVGGGAPNVTVNLIESPGNGGQVNQKQDGNNLTLDIMVEKIEGMMGRNIRQGRGIAPVIEGQYGLNRAAGAY